MPNEDRRVLRLNEAAKQYGLARSTLKALIAEGKIPARKTGTTQQSAVLLEQRDLDAWFDSLPKAGRKAAA